MSGRETFQASLQGSTESSRPYRARVTLASSRPEPAIAAQVIDKARRSGAGTGRYIDDQRRACYSK